MVKKLITVELSSGLEARPAAMLVQVASQYESLSLIHISPWERIFPGCCLRVI